MSKIEKLKNSIWNFINNKKVITIIWLVVLFGVIYYNIPQKLKFIPSNWFLFIFIITSLVVWTIFYKSYNYWKKLNIIEWIIITLLTSISTFFCFLSPNTGIYDEKDITKTLNIFTAFGPLIIGFATVLFACKQYQISKDERDDTKKQEIETKIADLNYLILYLHIRLEYLVKFNNFVESSSEVIKKLKDGESITNDERLQLNTTPINQSMALQIDIKKYSYMTQNLIFLRNLNYTETNLKHLNNIIELFLSKIQYINQGDYPDILNNWKTIITKDASAIYFSLKSLNLYNKEFLKFNLNDKHLIYDKYERKLLAKSLREYRKEAQELRKENNGLRCNKSKVGDNV